MKTNEAQALITAAGVHLRTYKKANAALKACKSELLDYMDDSNLVDLPGSEDGSGARIIEKSSRYLQLEYVPEALIIWCAKNGILTGALGKFDELPAEQRETLAPFVGRGEATRYVDLYFPSWAEAGQAKKAAARAESTATPIPLVAAPPRKPQEKAPKPRQPAEAEQDTRSLNCPNHPDRASKESKWGGSYCTAADEDGNYCKWTSKKKAA